MTSSVAGTKSVPGNAVYCGTKHFVKAMMDSFRSESVMEGNDFRQEDGGILTEPEVMILRFSGGGVA